MVQMAEGVSFEGCVIMMVVQLSAGVKGDGLIRAG
jgi:hypothetical protein